LAQYPLVTVNLGPGTWYKVDGREILAHPERFHRKRIRTEGYYSLGRETMSLSFPDTDTPHQDVWLDPPPETGRVNTPNGFGTDSNMGAHVVVFGTFFTSARLETEGGFGHMGEFEHKVDANYLVFKR